jgi:hypothetical protein
MTDGLFDIEAPTYHLPSPEEVYQAQTVNGGWTRDTLARWGVPWPPPKGWRRRLREDFLAEQERLGDRG